ncbi:methionine/alanine import family NSS transporter small subunit [Gracilibacillus thailandensis]|uniref:Methionine/alanine import family NSS transporter small subunit n=1 Tax=Gracilibacillus thailandensis TaxID=563735 RepID=A0A6N7R478_9BACI|nr:methionine/alanine import family NSS transporter small subunit [Gracilibacillus thailandensis]MRI68024.1 methionine/alanine import family NSS transporter small subunit [Gracilibacillus thailandensis]
MSGSAITMAVIGMVIIWGGLIASVIKAITASKH